ncbi:MAG: class II aldolase/adducin family protein [Deltaproteobacteria bacterium]|nr:class II aldolase/adducin family protein [Deltaproteobacteria bacterium]
MTLREGVVQFNLTFLPADPLPEAMLRSLNAWRQILHRIGLIGQEPHRYGGLGFGNVSIRLESGNPDSFIISGTQTGSMDRLFPEHYALVKTFDPATNSVVAEGVVRPSSESLTHGSLYRVSSAIGAVIHAHSPEIWAQAESIGIPVTHRDVRYGTPAMADEVCRLFQNTPVNILKIFAMGGHEDGIVSFGSSIEEAGLTIVRYLALATAKGVDTQ